MLTQMKGMKSLSRLCIQFLSRTIKAMKNKAYMVLLVDRQKAKMFTLTDGAVERVEELKKDHVPQKVKHGDDAWDAQDKIFRHIENHLHRHLTIVAQKASLYITKNNIAGIIIGSHKPLFSKIEKHLLYPLSRKIKGRFVTELKAPFNEILRRAKVLIDQIEKKETVGVS